MNRSEGPNCCLDRYRLQKWLDDPKGPLGLSANVLQLSEQRKRALAEIDGIYAGLTFLNKVEGGDDAPCAGHSSAAFDDSRLPFALESQYPDM